MGEKIKKLFKKCGKEVKIYPLAKIVIPENVEIDDYSIIDDFTFIEGGKGIIIGKYVHIANFTSIIGGGKLEMEDFSGLSAGCRIITGTDDFFGKSLTNPCIPLKYRTVYRDGIIKICKHALLGTNTIVHPNVTIGEGAVTGSNTLVTKDLEPWTIYVGSPAKKLKSRGKNLLQGEKKLLNNKKSGKK
jgi:galactoside O-acetyltransferase